MKAYTITLKDLSYRKILLVVAADFGEAEKTALAAMAANDLKGWRTESIALAADNSFHSDGFPTLVLPKADSPNNGFPTLQP